MTTARPQLYRSESARPIIQVDDVGFVANSLEQSDCCTTKKGESLEVIRIAVDVRARKVVRRFDEVSRRAERIADSHRHLRLAATPIHFEIFDVRSGEQITIN